MDNGFKIRNGINLNPQTSQPANGSNGDVYYDSVMGGFQGYASGSWGPLGSGMGGAGVNLIGMNSSFQPVNTNDVNADGTIGNWAAYADAADVQPVDMTGGSPTVAISRTTTSGEVLNGLGSFKVVKDAANRQGEGVSVPTNVPVGYRGTPLTILLPFKIISGVLSSGDVKLFIYDITNSQVVTPTNNDVISGFNLLQATFDNLSPSCTQFRFGFHFASTSALAVTFSFDDVFVGSSNVSLGLAMSDWKNDLTWTTDNFGTITNFDFRYRRVGDAMEVEYKFRSGVSVAATAAINFPSGYLMDANKLSTNVNGTMLGHNYRASASGGYVDGDHGSILFYDGSTTNKVFFATNNSSQTQLTKNAGTSIVDPANNQLCVGRFTIPIASWSTNVAQGNSSSFFIANVLSNGTRVTATPAKLGEYRTYTQNASANTGSDNAPSTGPTTLDGMRIFSVPFTSSGTSGQTNRWEIFVGKNKHVKLQAYASTGRTGWINTDISIRNTGEQNGLSQAYDPVTGVFIIDTIEQNSTTTNNFVGEVLATAGGNSTFPTDCYFDLIVSENVLPVQLESKRILVSTEASISAGGSGSIGNFDLTMTGVKPNTVLEVSIQPNINSIGATRSLGSGGGGTVDHETDFTLYRGINGASPTAIAQFSVHRLDNTAGEYILIPSSAIRYLDVYPTPGDIRYYFTATSANGVTLNWLEPSIMIVREV